MRWNTSVSSWQKVLGIVGKKKAKDARHIEYSTFLTYLVLKSTYKKIPIILNSLNWWLLPEIILGDFNMIKLRELEQGLGCNGYPMVTKDQKFSSTC